MADEQRDSQRYAPKRDLTYLYGHDENGREGKISALAVIDRVAAATFTPDFSDNGELKIISDAAAVAVTLRNDLPVGFSVRVIQGDAGVITLSGQAGATVRAPDGAETSGQWSGITAVVIGQGINGKTAEWLLG